MLCGTKLHLVPGARDKWKNAIEIFFLAKAKGYHLSWLEVPAIYTCLSEVHTENLLKARDGWGSKKFMSRAPSFLWLDCGRTSWLLHMWKDFRSPGCYWEHCWNTQSQTWKLGKYRLICSIFLCRRYYIWQNIYIWKCLLNIFIDLRFYPDIAGERKELWSNSNILFFSLSFWSEHPKSKGNRGFSD